MGIKEKFDILKRWLKWFFSQDEPDDPDYEDDIIAKLWREKKQREGMEHWIREMEEKA